MIVWLNGQLVERQSARISIFDRGFLFGDGVYEGLRAESGRIIGMPFHMSRMSEGLEAMRMTGFDPADLPEMTSRLLQANALEHAFVYWQVTRGTPGPADIVRNRIPDEFTPTVIGFATPLQPIASMTGPGIRTAVTLPDSRWTRGRIKCISLAGSVLAAIEAQEHNADDAILVRDGHITEATSSNVFIIKDGAIATPDLAGDDILAGVTRRLLLDELPEISVRPIAIEELKKADEIALCGTSTMVAAVSHLDDRPVGENAPGPGARKLFDALCRAIKRDLAGVAID